MWAIACVLRPPSTSERTPPIKSAVLRRSTRTLYDTVDDIGETFSPNHDVDKRHVSEIRAGKDFRAEIPLTRRQPHYILPMDGFR